MTVVSALQVAEFRLAQHYLDRLRTAAEAVRRGHANLLYGLNLFDQDSQHIQHWYAVVVQRSGADAEWARLCKEYPLAGRDVLATRIHAAEYLTWLESALRAARQLDDAVAERAILYELAVTHYRLGALEQVGEIAAQLLALGEAAGDRLAVGRGLDGLGRVAEERGRYAEASEHYERALRVFEELGIRTDIGHALNGLGSVATYLGDYHTAYQYYSRQLELMETEEKRSEYCSALLAVGDTLVRLKDFAGAEKALTRAISLCRTLGFRRLLGMGLINLGSAAAAQSQFDLACAHLTEGIHEVRAVGVQRQTIHGLSLLGYARLRQGRTGDALAHLREGLEMARRNGMPRYICSLQRNLADTYLALGNAEAARQALWEALIIARELGMAPEIAKTLTCAVAYGHQRGVSERAAVWAGALAGSAYLDDALFALVCRELERALSAAQLQAAFERGQGMAVEAVASEVLALLDEGSERDGPANTVTRAYPLP